MPAKLIVGTITEGHDLMSLIKKFHSALNCVDTASDFVICHSRMKVKKYSLLFPFGPEILLAPYDGKLVNENIAVESSRWPHVYEDDSLRDAARSLKKWCIELDLMTPSGHLV